MKNVIHIFGAAGSGATTLGKRIADELGYKLLDVDDYFWMPVDPPYTIKRPVEERLYLMKQEIDGAERVVISGSLTDWGDVLIPYFTLAVRLHTDTRIRLERLKKRERDLLGSRIDKGGDMYENHAEFLEWAAEYDTADTSIRSKAKHDEWQKLLPCPVLNIDGSDLYSFDLDLIKQYLF